MSFDAYFRHKASAIGETYQTRQADIVRNFWTNMVRRGPGIFLYLYKLLNKYGEAGPRILLYLDKLLNVYGDAWSRDFPLFI